MITSSVQITTGDLRNRFIDIPIQCVLVMGAVSFLVRAITAPALQWNDSKYLPYLLDITDSHCSSFEYLYRCPLGSPPNWSHGAKLTQIVVWYSRRAPIVHVLSDDIVGQGSKERVQGRI